MLPLLPILALVVAIVVLLRRAAVRQRAAQTALVERIVAASAGTLTTDDPRIDKARASRAETLALRGTHRSADDAAFAIAAFIHRPPEARALPFDLKTDGLRTLPHLVGPEVEALDRQDLAHSQLAGTPLRILYRIRDDKQAGQTGHVTVQQLSNLGIDAAAIHSVSIAVLRQQFEPEIVRRAAGGEMLDLRGDSAASGLLLVGENLLEDETLLAWVPDPDRLVLAPPGATPPADLMPGRLLPTAFEVRPASLRLLPD